MNMWVCMHVCANVGEDADRGCMQEFEGGNKVPLCTMNQRSNSVWRGSGWACLWDVPSWASEAVEEAAAAELVCCRPTIGQKCYSWEGLCKLGRSISRCSFMGLESYRVCWLQPRHITSFDRNGLKQRSAPPWFPRPRVEIISHRLTNYFEAENKASTKASHSQ